MTTCPACKSETLSAHCDGFAQAVFPCDWRKCTDPKCQATFDPAAGRGYRIGADRPMIKSKAGQVPPLVRMYRDTGGDWHDDPRDGV